jgi:hypothetical protein
LLDPDRGAAPPFVLSMDWQSLLLVAASALVIAGFAVLVSKAAGTGSGEAALRATE